MNGPHIKAISKAKECPEVGSVEWAAVQVSESRAALKQAQSDVRYAKEAANLAAVNMELSLVALDRALWERR